MSLSGILTDEIFSLGAFSAESTAAATVRKPPSEGKPPFLSLSPLSSFLMDRSHAFSVVAGSAVGRRKRAIPPRCKIDY